VLDHSIVRLGQDRQEDGATAGAGVMERHLRTEDRFADPRRPDDEVRAAAEEPTEQDVIEARDTGLEPMYARLGMG
jgi:hypothetical protein